MLCKLSTTQTASAETKSNPKLPVQRPKSAQQGTCSNLGDALNRSTSAYQGALCIARCQQNQTRRTTGFSQAMIQASLAGPPTTICSHHNSTEVNTAGAEHTRPLDNAQKNISGERLHTTSNRSLAWRCPAAACATCATKHTTSM